MKNWHVAMLIGFAIVVWFLIAASSWSESRIEAPAIHQWQAKRIAYGFTIRQHRPGYSVVHVLCRTRYRCRVEGNEPGYLGDDPDVTITTVERRGYQFWVRDPFTYTWGRWL